MLGAALCLELTESETDIVTGMAGRKLTANEQAILDKLSPIHRPAVGKLLIAQQDILDALRKDRLSTPTGIVHHYSDKNGLEGITKSGLLWLSDYTTMPDTGEIEYGFNLGMEVLRQAYEDGPKTGRLRRFLRGTQAVAKRGLPKYFHAYILSLTPKGDALPQWREYADNATGFCLGFNSRILDRAFVSFTKATGLEASGSFKVLYNERRLRSLVTKYVRNAFDAVLWLPERPKFYQEAAEAMKEIGVNLLFAFIFTALFFKHRSYESENEYRYIVMTFPDNRIPGLKKRRGKKGRRVGYFEFDWRSHHAHALKLVRIGPARKEAQGRQSVRKALAQAHLSAKVVMSGIPPIKL
jgi:hypothetical protein